MTDAALERIRADVRAAQAREAADRAADAELTAEALRGDAADCAALLAGLYDLAVNLSADDPSGYGRSADWQLRRHRRMADLVIFWEGARTGGRRPPWENR